MSRPLATRTMAGFWKPSSQWVCSSCARSKRTRSPTLAKPSNRYSSSSKAKMQQATAHVPQMEQIRAMHNKKNQTVLYYTLSAILGTVALSYGSVPMYKMICQQMGWGGQPIRSTGHGSTDSDPSKRLTPVKDANRLRITFAGSTSDILPWKFVPQQREVRVLPGETALAFYTAHNESESDIIGIATYSVSPPVVAPYFSKIQCFCFEEQRLNAGEEVDMPVFFYIDPQFLEDPNMKGIETITLNYTFFKARYDKDGHLRPVPR